MKKNDKDGISRGLLMKKFMNLLIAAMFFLGFAMMPSVSYAVEAKLGAVAMADWWKPAFLRLEKEAGPKFFSYEHKDDLDGSFLMGPTLWVKLTEEWGMGFTALFGLSRHEIRYTTYAGEISVWSLPYLMPLDIVNTSLDIGKSKIRRYDADLNFERSIHKYLNLLIGLRFNYNDGEGSSYRIVDNLGISGFNVKKEEFSAWYAGPSLGVGFHIEPVSNFTIGLGVSALFQFGNYDLEKKVAAPLPLRYIFPYKYSIGYFCIGLDSNVKFAYLISAINIEVWIGGRYILLPHISAGDKGSKYDLSYKSDWISGELEHYGGLLFGVAYKFQ
jgi:hypothetical protein